MEGMEDIALISAASRPATDGSAGGRRERELPRFTATAGVLDNAVEGAKAAAAGVARRCTIGGVACDGTAGPAHECSASGTAGMEDSGVRLSPVEACS
jgi:hypothetical protein